jgi:DNA polymerase III subunit epsilon
VTFDSQDFLLFDVQTTGTNPETSAILEVGWGIYRAALDPETIPWHVHLVSLEDKTLLTARIQRLTGLTEKAWVQETSIDLQTLREQLREFLAQHPDIPILLHYARFKKPFLMKVLDLEINSFGLEHHVICTYELAKLRFPALKSYSLRAVAGYAGFSLGDKKRSRDHLTATAFVWQHMAKPKDSDSTCGSTLPLQSKTIRSKRLALPSQPGVYYFLDRVGRILYIGKAANLHHRLNSYFRGQKTKGSRLNEMLTRAVDFTIRIVGSELEALLLESDEVKRWDPPYNRLLKSEGRLLHAFRLNAHLRQPVSWGEATWGPLPQLASLQWLLQLIGEGPPGGVLAWTWVYDVFNEACLKEGLRLLFGTDEPHIDQFHALSRSLWEEWRQRAEEEPEADEENVQESPLEVKEATPERASAFIQQTLLGVVRQIHRARWILRLMECSIEWKPRDRQPFSLQIFAGKPLWTLEQNGEFTSPAWEKSREERLLNLDIATYDRLAIVLSELRQGVRRGDEVRLHLRSRLVLNEVHLQKWVQY